jgi:hypothetical protein
LKDLLFGYLQSPRRGVNLWRLLARRGHHR